MKGHGNNRLYPMTENFATYVVFIITVSFSGVAQSIDNSFVLENSPVIAFTGVRIIDGTGVEPMEEQTLVVRQGRITGMGPDGSVTIPEEAKKIPLQGKTLLPGWVMHHEHLYYGSDHRAVGILTQQPITFPRLYLSAGITSARTTGSIEPYTDLRIKESIDAGILVGPDFDLTAPYLEGASAAVLQQHVLKNADEARDMVRYWAGQGFTSFKAYTHITREQLAAAVDEAHRLGLKVTAHLCSITYREAAEIGVDQLEHGFIPATDFNSEKKPNECPSNLEREKVLSSLMPGDEKVQELFRFLIDKQVVVTSTLDELERWARMEPDYPDDEIYLMDIDTREKYQQLLASRVESSHSELIKKLFIAGQSLEAGFWRAGGKLTVGTDPTMPGTLPGYGSLRSIELLAEAGIPPLEVIKIATQNGAEAMGVLDDRGTITVGKRADLIIINGDPSIDIKNIYKIEAVFKKGVGYDPVALRKSVVGKVGGPG